MTTTPPVRFRLIPVYAGTSEPVREPQLFYAPVRKLQTSSGAPVDRIRAVQRKTEIVPAHQNGEGDRVAYAPTAIPSDLVAMLDTDAAAEPGLGSAGARTRNLTLPFPLGEEPMAPPPEPPPGDADVKPPPVIGGDVEQAVLIEQVKPEYPALARTARVEGIVVLEGTINEQGKVMNVHVVNGHPMLVEAAIKAVKKWKYRPAKLNGQIISCPLRVQVRFSLRYPGD